LHYLEEDITKNWPIQPEHLLATLLHPRLRDFAGDILLKDQAIQLLQSSVASCTSLSNDTLSTCNTSSASSVDTSTTLKESNILSSCFDKPRSTKPVDDEVLLWLKSDFDTEIINDDLLSFWRRKKNEFPTIASIARKVLSIPAANTSVERLFSSSKIIIGDKRTRLSSEKIDKLMFLKKNLASLKQMFDSKNGSTITLKRKPDDIYEEEDDDDDCILKKYKGVEEDDYNLLMDDYDSEEDGEEANL